MAADFDATRELMADPTVIYLQPACCADEAVGRLWCEDDAPVDCEDGVPWTKYVRADEIERLRAELESVRQLMNVYNLGGWTDALAPMQRALKAEAERDALLKLLGDIYPIAEEEWGHYKIEWNSIGGNLMARIRAAIDAARGKDDQA